MSETTEQFLERAGDSVRLQKALCDAAPELLEALERLVLIQSGLPMSGVEAEQWLQDARAAIARAKGEVK